MSQLVCFEKQHHNRTFVMALGFYACQSLIVNFLAVPAGELDEFASAYGPASRSNVGSNKVSNSPEAPILPFIPSPIEDFFTRFMKLFMMTTQAPALAESRERPLKAKILETYFGKSHINCYHFCQ